MGSTTKAPKNFNTFGGSLGGPLRLGDAHTFFFADIESNRRRTSLPQQLSVPTAAMRAGDLSALGVAILDPLTEKPFSNNQIPASRLNATSLALLNGYYPLPNVAGTDTNANLRRLVSTPSDTNGYDVRIDQAFGTRHQVFGRWSAKNLDTTVANGLLPSETNGETDRNLVLSHNWIMNAQATLINELRFGVSRFHLGVAFPVSGASAIQQLGLQGLDISNHPLTNAFPTFDFSDGTGFTPIGRDKTGVTESQTTQIADNLIWVRGRHAYKFGFDFRNLRYFDLESFGGSNDFGAFTFSANTFTGNAFADFLLGLPAKSYVARSGPDIDGRVKQYGFYGQDTWNAGKRLTINYGMRWQVLPPFIDANGNITIFNPATGGVIVPGGSQPQSAPTAGFLVSINACPGYNAALPCAPIQTSQQYGVGPGPTTDVSRQHPAAIQRRLPTERQRRHCAPRRSRQVHDDASSVSSRSISPTFTSLICAPTSTGSTPTAGRSLRFRPCRRAPAIRSISPAPASTTKTIRSTTRIRRRCSGTPPSSSCCRTPRRCASATSACIPIG